MLETSGAKMDLSSGRSNWRIGYSQYWAYEIYNIAPPSACIFRPGFVAIRKSTATFEKHYA